MICNWRSCPHLFRFQIITQEQPVGTLREGVIHITEEITINSTGTESETGTTEAEVNSTQQGTETESSENPAPATGSEEESFFDPNNLPEELMPAYKQMQGAFTKKTQEIAERMKETETLKTTAAEYEKYKPYIPIVEEMLSSRQQGQEQVANPALETLKTNLAKAGYSEEAIEMMEMGIGFALNQFNQTQAQTKEVERLTSQIDAAGAVDPRLNDQSLTYEIGDGEKATFGQIVENLVAADPNWKKDPVAATKRAIKTVDALVNRAKTQGKEELSTLAKTKATKFPPTNSSPQGSTAANASLSVEDAFARAQAETGISLN